MLSLVERVQTSGSIVSSIRFDWVVLFLRKLLLSWHYDFPPRTFGLSRLITGSRLITASGRSLELSHVLLCVVR